MSGSLGCIAEIDNTIDQVYSKKKKKKIPITILMPKCSPLEKWILDYSTSSWFSSLSSFSFYKNALVLKAPTPLFGLQFFLNLSWESLYCFHIYCDLEPAFINPVGKTEWNTFKVKAWCPVIFGSIHYIIFNYIPFKYISLTSAMSRYHTDSCWEPRWVRRHPYLWRGQDRSTGI